MKNHTMAVWLLALVASGWLFGVGTAVAQEESTADGPNSQMSPEEAKRRAQYLREDLQKREKHLAATLKPTVADADRMIKQLQDQVKKTQQTLDRLRAEAVRVGRSQIENNVRSEEIESTRKEFQERQEPVKAQLEIYNRLLDHYRLARAKLDPDASVVADLVGGPELSETAEAKAQSAKITQIKKELALLEDQITKLESPSATPNSGPGVVPNLKGMTIAQVNAALRQAQLRVAIKLDGPASEQDKLKVTEQSHAAGTTLKPGEGVVTVTLSIPAQAPKDGRYRLTFPNSELLGTVEMVWTNQEDGSARVRMIVEQASILGTYLSEAQISRDNTFNATASADKKAYIVGGADFQAYARKLTLPTSPDLQVRNVQSNLRFVVTSEGENVRLKPEGRVSWTQTNTDERGNQSTANKAQPEIDLTLVGTMIQ
jgi:hypothetical protein